MPVILLALALLLLLLGIVFIAAVAMNLLTTPLLAPTPTALDLGHGPQVVLTIAPAAAEAASQRLAVIDNDRIYTIAADGSNRVELNPGGSVPTAALIWSRDGQHLIYAQVDGVSSHLLSARPDGSESVTLYEGEQTTAPFYLDGAPNDANVAFLVPDANQGMVLRIAPTDRARTDRAAVSGQPNYVSWSPDGSALVVHIGGAGGDAFVGTYALSQTQVNKIEQNPALFQAPSWSPTGEAQWLYARKGANRNEFVIDNGREAVPLTQFDDGITFSWSPDGQAIAYALNTPDSFLYQGLTVIDRAGRQPHVYYRSNLLAFFWSPDGQHLAFLTGELVQQEPTGRIGGLAVPSVRQNRRTLQVTWHVVDLKSGSITDLNTFEPTESFLYVIQYFDQFAQSIALWSPDSRWLVYTGQSLIGERGVYIIDTRQTGEPKPQYLGPGEFAIWSWK